MWKIITLIIDLKDHIHKLEDRCKELYNQRNKWEEQYNALYFQVQNLLGENNETLVTHYDGTDIPEYSIEEIKYGDKNEK